MSTPIICLDFDGVLHSYTSGWQGADVIPDGPVDGASEFVKLLIARGFQVAVFSARSHQTGGLSAMATWWRKHGFPPMGNYNSRPDVFFPDTKPAALLYVDDRGFRFEGDFVPVLEMIGTKMLPWNKK